MTHTDRLVWAATSRKGIDYHLYDAGAENRTLCGRSTGSYTSWEGTEDAARSAGMNHCPRCAKAAPSPTPDPVRHGADRPQLDITIGEVRVVIGPTGLIGLHRVDEHLTLIPSEAREIAALLLARLGPPADGYRISDRAAAQRSTTNEEVHHGDARGHRRAG